MIGFVDLHDVLVSAFAQNVNLDHIFIKFLFRALINNLRRCQNTTLFISRFVNLINHNLYSKMSFNLEKLLEKCDTFPKAPSPSSPTRSQICSGSLSTMRLCPCFLLRAELTDPPDLVKGDRKLPPPPPPLLL